MAASVQIKLQKQEGWQGADTSAHSEALGPNHSFQKETLDGARLSM